MGQPGTTSAPALPTGHLSGREQPVLGAGDLTLRPWLHSDAPALVQAYQDPAIHRWHSRSLSTSQAESWVQYELNRWQQERGAGWAICTDGSLAGRIAIGDLNLHEASAEVSYWVLPGHRGRGLAPRALTVLTDWLFADFGLHRLELEHSVQNPASCRVAIKAGFPVEGIKRSKALHLDGWHDMHAHAMVAGDVRPIRRENPTLSG